MSYTITLADGRQLKGLGLNSRNFVSVQPVDETIFDSNLSTLTISDGETEQTYHNIEFVQQQAWSDGYHLIFRQKTMQELEMEELRKAIGGAQDAIYAQLAEAYREGVQSA